MMRCPDRSGAANAVRWLVLLLAACGNQMQFHGDDIVDSHPGDVVPTTCNPVTQTGCNPSDKCTWIIDQTVPIYVGHIGCVPDGTAPVGSACEFGAAGATGFDNCAKAGVCSAFASPETPGTCKQICDNAGGNPMCDASHVCAAYSKLFSTGVSSPAAAGVCDVACNPLTDNDFDGSGSASHKTTSTCGSATNIGCYGLPSGGTPPATGWTCTGDINASLDGTDLGLRHRAECTTSTGCADTDGTIYVNSCNQGYLPLLRESTAVSTTVCIAMCAPLDCYAGNCGSNNVNRIGAAPHRCANPDAVGTFGSGEECQYLWARELDGSGHWLPSPTSNSVGFCVDHDAYGMPRCEDLPLHGSGSALGAVDLGCVSTTTGAVQ